MKQRYHTRVILFKNEWIGGGRLSVCEGWKSITIALFCTPESNNNKQNKKTQRIPSSRTACDKVLGQNEYSNSSKCQKSSCAVSVGAEWVPSEVSRGQKCFFWPKARHLPWKLTKEASHAVSQSPGFYDMALPSFPSPCQGSSSPSFGSSKVIPPLRRLLCLSRQNYRQNYKFSLSTPGDSGF